MPIDKMQGKNNLVNVIERYHPVVITSFCRVKTTLILTMSQLSGCNSPHFVE
jgi:hypothetical protein